MARRSPASLRRSARYDREQAGAYAYLARCAREVLADTATADAEPVAAATYLAEAERLERLARELLENAADSEALARTLEHETTTTGRNPT